MPSSPSRSLQRTTHPVTPVDLDNDAPGLLQALLSGFGNSSAIVNMFYPVSIWPEHVAEILKQGAERIRSERDNPNMHWMKVSDPVTGEIFAGIQWKFNITDPYSGVQSSPAVVPFWLPDTPLTPRVRELANVAMKAYVAPRAPMRRRPHAWINATFTRADCQHRGMAGDLIEWGTRRADELGLEAHVEASAQGRPVYARYGFIQVATHHVQPDVGDDEELAELCKIFNFPQIVYLMWRPVGGRFEAGKTPIPWKGGLKPDENWQQLFEE